MPRAASARLNSRPAHKNGVKDVVEVKVGYDGIVLAQSKAGASLNLTRKDVYLALAKTVPDPANPTTLIPNPYTTWKDVNKSLPAMKIEVLGPPPTSGTRDSFVELYMEAGCRTFAWLNALRTQDEPRFKRACDTVREDGAYVEAGENDNLIVQKLDANKDAVGIFGYSFLEENLDKLKGAVVDGVSPTYETDRLGQVSGLAPALHLREEGARERDPAALPNSSPSTPARRRWARKVIWPTRA